MTVNQGATKLVASVLTLSMLLTSCASTTLIETIPEGANLYINEESVGTSPYLYTDTKIVGSINMVRVEKEGYETLNTSFSRNEEADAGAIVGGIFLLVPFLWTMKYKPTHTYELTPLVESEKKIEESTPEESPSNDNPSKADSLRELKKLLDEGIITQEEFDSEKKKILAK
ncbi:MAG: SHOCT domain-containing protein [Bacteroidia bacterium]|nr:SHOCT domain-containing protein [Bacteroidia bacterium]